MSKPYFVLPDFTNWYWIVNGDDTKVYSSATNTYVSPDDPAYKAFVDGGSQATRIVSEAELYDVLVTAAPSLIADWMFDGTTFVQPAANLYTKTQLKAYSASKRYEVEVGGIEINGARIATDRQSQAMVNGAYAYTALNTSAVINYKTQGGFVQLNAAAIQGIANAVGAHVQAAFAAESSIAGQIDSGTLTTLAAVDAAYAAVV